MILATVGVDTMGEFVDPVHYKIKQSSLSSMRTHIFLG